MAAASRLDLRLNTRDKDRIARAAKLNGVSVSTFFRNAALHATAMPSPPNPSRAR